MAEWSESQDKYFHDWKRVRSAIEHKNNLVNHRLTWLFLAQGGLFTAFFSSSGEATGFIRVCVAVFGMFICGFMFVPLREADKALVGLNDWWGGKLTDRPEECRLHRQSSAGAQICPGISIFSNPKIYALFSWLCGLSF